MPTLTRTQIDPTIISRMLHIYALVTYRRAAIRVEASRLYFAAAPLRAGRYVSWMYEQDANTGSFRSSASANAWSASWNAMPLPRAAGGVKVW